MVYQAVPSTPSKTSPQTAVYYSQQPVFTAESTGRSQTTETAPAGEMPLFPSYTNLPPNDLSWGQREEEPDTRYYSVVRNSGIRSGTGVLTAYRGTEVSLILPPVINGVIITEIGGAAFSGKHLNEIYLPETITAIGDGAFSGNNLGFITIPDSVSAVGNQAFSGNPLREITIGSNVAMGPDTFGAAFYGVYSDNGRLGGRYVLAGKSWLFTTPR